jgi:hypothetical protein
VILAALEVNSVAAAAAATVNKEYCCNSETEMITYHGAYSICMLMERSCNSQTGYLGYAVGGWQARLAYDHHHHHNTNKSNHSNKYKQKAAAAAEAAAFHSRMNVT